MYKNSDVEVSGCLLQKENQNGNSNESINYRLQQTKRDDVQA